MATLVSSQLEWTADQIVHHSGYSSAVLSGLAPDPRHLDTGGYHCSIDDLFAYGNGGDYSDVRPDDKGFNAHNGAALDVSLARSDMIRAYTRIHAVWADHSDPRRMYVNAINCWCGSGDAVRLDFYAGTSERASSDHQWHTHSEFRRRYVLDPKAARALVSIYQGESKAAWIAREDPIQPPTPPSASHQPGSRTLAETDPIMTGDDVKFVQRWTGATADGEFGPATKDRVVRYQKIVGLAADGIVGRKTWAAMGVKWTGS